MSILGNIFLAIASLLFLLFGFSVIGKEAPRGGDAVMGYVWGIILFYLVFFACIAVVAISIGWKGGFEWVSHGKGMQFLLVTTGLFTSLLTAGLSLLSKGEPGFAASILRAFGWFAPMLVPLTLIVCGAILLNDGWKAAVPPAAYKIPLTAVFWVGVCGAAAGLIGWAFDANQNAVRKLEEVQSDQQRYHQGYLDDIDSCDVTKNMSHILVFTDANHDQDVRDRAIAKIKTNPAWQQELVRLLENKGAIEAFDFLASNEVDDKNLFLAPVNTGVLSVAEWVRKQIRDAYQEHHFYEDQFSWQVERILRTVDKFEGLGTDYRPAVRALRDAFEEPAEVKKPKFKCIPQLDRWIERHQKD